MAKFWRGQKLVCVHYKSHPVVTVDHWNSYNEELWVKDSNPKFGYWWGPANWFRAVRKDRR